MHLVRTDTSGVANLPSVHLFNASTKLQKARDAIAQAEEELRASDDLDEFQLLRQELSDLNWRTQSLAMKLERDEQKRGQHKGPLTPATDFPDYDAGALKDAQHLLAQQDEDLADQAASLPPNATIPDTGRPGVLRRAYDAVGGFSARLFGSASG
jgi:hypothetical protein